MSPGYIRAKENKSQQEGERVTQMKGILVRLVG